MPKRTIQTVVVDASVFADYYFLYPRKPERHERARTILDKLSSLGLPVYEPFLLEVELRAVLVRRVEPDRVLEMLNAVLMYVNVIGEEFIHNDAAEVALLTGCRAVDAYYIATAKHINAVLITNDRVMKYNALKAGVEAYYLLDVNDYNIFIKRLNNPVI